VALPTGTDDRVVPGIGSATALLEREASVVHPLLLYELELLGQVGAMGVEVQAALDVLAVTPSQGRVDVRLVPGLGLLAACGDGLDTQQMILSILELGHIFTIVSEDHEV